LSFDKPTPKAEQLSVGLYASDTYQYSPDLSFYFGGRLDRLKSQAEALDQLLPNGTFNRRLFEASSDTTWAWQLHTGLTWRMAPSWTSKFLLSAAYRAPDIMERFKFISLSNTTIYGNPELKPERSLFAEYGLGYHNGPLQLDLSLFANFVNDYITEKVVSASEIRMDNVASARIYGVELSGRYAFPVGLDLYGNLTYLRGQDRAERQPLAGVAPFKALVGLEYRHGSGFWASLEGKFVAGQSRTPRDVRESDAYSTASLGLGYDFEGQARHQIALQVDNLFDAKYDNYLANQRGYTVWEPGLSAVLTYTLSF
jgi:hemoglobin/transferrin/lactoferrin receptor protein